MNKGNIVVKIKETGKLEIFKDLLEKKEYDTIYSLFGKYIYSIFTPLEYKKEDIHRLLNEGNIGEINRKYGKLDTLFIKNFRRMKKSRIKSLIKDGRFLELYDTFGDKVFKKNEGKIYEQDILYETGSKLKAKSFRFKKAISKDIKNSFIYMVLEPVVFLILSNSDTYLYFKDEYNEMIALANYNNSIKTYATNIKDLNIDNDIDLVIKLLNDSKLSEPFYNEQLFPYDSRTFIYSSPGKSIKIDIYDDFALRLNTIDSRYEANEIKGNNYKTEDGLDYYFVTFKPIEKDYTMVLDNKHSSIGFIYDDLVFILPKMDITDSEFSNNIEYFTITGVDHLDSNNNSIYHNPSKEEMREIFVNWNESLQGISLIGSNKKGVN